MPDDLLTTARRGAALGSIPPDLADRLIDEVDRLQANASALADALSDIAGMRPVIDGGREMWISDAECSDLRGIPCHALEPESPENWCSVCVAEVAWCAWKMGALA